jgi:PAS domain-containing protein
MAECPQNEADRISGENRNGTSEERSLITAQLRVAANAIPAHVWYATPSGVLVFVNSRIADYLGLPQDHPLRFGIDVGGGWNSHIAFCIRTITKRHAEFGLRAFVLVARVR